MLNYLTHKLRTHTINDESKVRSYEMHCLTPLGCLFRLIIIVKGVFFVSPPILVTPSIAFLACNVHIFHMKRRIGKVTVNLVVIRLNMNILSAV